MDASIKEQIYNILKKNKFDEKKFRFVKLNDTIYKIYYNDLFVTYIECDTNIQNTQLTQKLNWKCYRDNFVDYIKKLEKFNFDVVCLVEIVDTKILDKCIASLKNQTNEPYIILIVSSHNEKQYAVNHNIDFFWTAEKLMYTRISAAIKSVKGTIKFVKNVMICNSNDIFFDNWVHDGVKLITEKKYDVVGTEKQYLVDLDKGYLYKRVLDQSYGKHVLTIPSLMGIFWYNGMIVNKAILHKLNWDIYCQAYTNNITYGVFDKLSKIDAKNGFIESAEMVSIFTENSLININDYITNRINIVESLDSLPLLNKPPISELNIKIKKITNKKVLPKMPEKKQDDKQIIVEEPKPKIISLSRNNIIKNVLSEKSKNKNMIPLINKEIIINNKLSDISTGGRELSIAKNLSDTQIQLRKKEAQLHQSLLLLQPKQQDNKVPMILIGKGKDKGKEGTKKNDKIVIPPEKSVKLDPTIPKIMLTDIEKYKNIHNKQREIKYNSTIVIPPEKSIKDNPEIPIIINKELLVNGKIVKNLCLNDLSTPPINSNQSTNSTQSNDIVIPKKHNYISSNRIVTIVLINGNNDISSLCIQYLENQSLVTDIVLLLSNSNQKSLAEKYRKPYYIYENSNEYARIQNVIKQIKNLNPGYIILIDDSYLVSKGWVEECYNRIKNGNYNIVGTNMCYVNNFKSGGKYMMELIPDNLNFLNRHFRPSWCFFNGRMMSSELLDKLSWNLFSNNYDVNIEVSLGVKLQTIGAKMGKLESSSMLCFVTDDQYSKYKSINYYRIAELNVDMLKKLHNTFDNVFGEYKEVDLPKAPLIQRKIVDKKLPNIHSKNYINGEYSVEISIVLPTWNGYPKIKTAIENIRNQTYKNYELLIINDGSTHMELVNYLDELKQEKKIKIISLQKNGGLPNALNIGIKNSRGKYWTWISDDNEIDENFLWKLKSQLDLGYGFVYSNYVLIDTLIAGTPTVNMEIQYNDVVDILDNWRGMPCYMWRKEVIDQIGYFDVNIQGCEDYEFVVKTFICCGDSISHIDDYLFTYYKRKNTLTTRLKDEIPKLVLQTKDKYIDGVYLKELHHQIYAVKKDIVIYISDTDHALFYQRSHHIMKLLLKDYICLYVTTNNKILIEKQNHIWYVNKFIFDLYVNNFNITNKNPIIYYNDPKLWNYKKIILPQCTIFDLINSMCPNNVLYINWLSDVTHSVNNADITLYSSKYLGEIVRNANPEKASHFINNACDYRYFMNTKTPLLSKPKEFINITKPIIGYYGAIDSRLDFDLIKKIADIVDIHVVMIGKVPNVPCGQEYNMLSVCSRSEAQLKNSLNFVESFSHENITWINHVEYSRIPYYLSWFDICMIPYKVNDINRGCNPIKFYEYCASGKVIIGSIFDDISIFYHKIDNINYEDIIANILKNNDLKSRNNEYIKFAQQNCWTKRINTLLDIIQIEYTIIYPPLIYSDFLMQRPTQLMKSFSKVNKIRAIFIENVHNAKEEKTYKHMVLNKTTFENRIKQYVKGQIILYYTYPDDIKYKKILKPDFVLYDLIDNPTEEFKNWDNINLIKSMEEADYFTCSAPILYDKYKGYNTNIKLISNGCEPYHFSPSRNRLIRPKDFPNVGNKKVIGYYGAHATWMDLELVKKIADYDPANYTVVMVGKSDKADYNIWFKHPNITWIDHKSYYELPNYLSYFDICMIPFKLTTMIKGCDPIKLYEYLAAGKPVITTKMEPILKFKNIIYFMDHKNYGNIIETAANSINDNKLIEKRCEVGLSNSWDSKANEIVSMILSKNIKITFFYPPFVRWNKMFQRPQQIITALSKKPGIRCVFVDFSINDVQIKNNSLIIVPSYEIAKQYMKGKIVLYYNHVSTVKSLKNYKYDYCIYELVDNPTDEFADWLEELDNAINHADSVSVTAKILTKYMGKDCKVINNGADYYHFERAQYKLKKPADMPNINNKIIIGYYGAHAPWVDWSLIKLIADLPYVHVVMIGSDIKPPYNIKFNHNNITWLPMKDYSELPYYLSWFDIAMIPFKLTEMIKGCDPIKFYEYSSAGKPVIATKMPELEKFSSICYFIDEKNYNTVIRKAISELKIHDLIIKRQEIMKNNTWDIRATEILKMVPFNIK